MGRLHRIKNSQNCCFSLWWKNIPSLKNNLQKDPLYNKNEPSLSIQPSNILYKKYHSDDKHVGLKQNILLYSLHFQKTHENMNCIIKRSTILLGNYIIMTACTLKFLRMRRNPVTAILRASTCLWKFYKVGSGLVSSQSPLFQSLIKSRHAQEGYEIHCNTFH